LVFSWLKCSMRALTNSWKLRVFSGFDVPPGTVFSPSPTISRLRFAGS